MIDAESPGLRHVIQHAIDLGRLGSPQFLRCICQVESWDRLEPALNELVSLADGWFGAHPVQRYRLGGDNHVYLTEVLKWPDGQGAIITASSGSSDPTSGLDLMLVGSRGTLYHET